MSTSNFGNFILIMIQDSVVLIALVAALFGVTTLDVTSAPQSPPFIPMASVDDSKPFAPPPSPPEIVPPVEILDPEPRIALMFRSTTDLGRMGVQTLSGDPDNTNDDKLQMTYATDGNTNNTLVSVDAQVTDYGSGRGTDRVAHREIAAGKYASEWKFRDIRFSQIVELVPGDVSRRLDTFRITFAATNEGTIDHIVGARFMIDTLIGRNDGVPFIVAGKQSLVTDAATFREGDIPDFVRALQNPSLTNPGVIVDIGLKTTDSDRPDEVVLSHWPGMNAKWLYNRNRSLGTDSAVGLYFNPKRMPSQQTRSMGFTYGLGAISSTNSKNSKMSLTAGGPFHAGGSFWLVALVQTPEEGAVLNIALPAGLKLGEAQPASQTLHGNEKFSQTSWLIVGEQTAVGDHEIRVTLTPGNLEERQTIKLQPPLATLSVRSPDKATAGKTFWVSALIRNPKQGQAVELILPKGLTFAADHAARKPVEMKSDHVQVNWLVKSELRTPGEHRLQVTLAPAGIFAECTVNLQVGNLID